MNETRSKTKSLILCALFAALIAVGAFIRVPVPVVPFTLQTLFTVLAGLLLGSRLGALSAAVYAAVGLLGIPVFTGGGGPGYIFHPTFGYIIAVIGGAWIAGYIVEKSKAPNIKTYLLAGLAHLSVVSTVGMVYYYFIANYYTHSPIGVGALILHCFLMTLPGDLVKCFLSAVLACKLRPVLR